MGKKRREFSRRKPSRHYRKLFLIATEGRKTEPIYFGMFNSQQTAIRITILPSKHKTSPPQVLRRAQSYVKQEQLRKNDEAWIVIDRDQWTDKQLDEVFEGCQALNFKLAVSNPKFEYWLLLHFENGSGVSSSDECSHKLLQYLPNYDKGSLEIAKIAPKIQDAIQRAEEKNSPPCEKWPNLNGSTVYLLVIKLNAETICLPKD